MNNHQLIIYIQTTSMLPGYDPMYSTRRYGVQVVKINSEEPPGGLATFLGRAHARKEWFCRENQVMTTSEGMTVIEAQAYWLAYLQETQTLMEAWKNE